MNGEHLVGTEQQQVHMKPRYIHDCDVCQFLGQTKDGDVYLCPKSFGIGRFNSFIVRFSDDGPDYWSSPDLGNDLLNMIAPEDAFDLLYKSGLI